ncbi:YegS/Rv2252/BmrU family lipid kinase [Pedobacter sp. JY14-1]|uniref:diacylglycerol/lipid kinase family protein n=1 Tax=Pedobacter sp. JY14-1 TaxID=3034151 RepID=UPI0023E1BACC|nr:YegS/Rv2252/BmrU family lipid kinase [Pedobacter sp. JY14-1]
MKLLYIINPGSGSKETDYSSLIRGYFAAHAQDHAIECFELPGDFDTASLKAVIAQSDADRVIAVGGDGTLKLVAECLLDTQIPVGVIPAGSANGMARELDIPPNFEEALEKSINGQIRKIHAISINDQFCIHLADIGFNAYLVKKFDDLPQRGMLGYARAAWKALWNHNKMNVELQIEGQTIRSSAAMVVIANATMYGTGVKINPEGRLDDNKFEVVLVKTYSVMEILKIWLTNIAFDPKHIEVFQTSNLQIKTKRKAHFQVDGEYLGKANILHAKLLPAAIQIIY